MNLAVFDLDHTLLPFDCEWVWINYVASHEGIDPKKAFAPLKPMYEDYYTRHHLDAEAFSRFQLSFISQFPRTRLDCLLSDFVRETVEPAISEAARDLVSSYIERGDATAICSGSYSYIVVPIARIFGIPEILCGEPETDAAGNFTGRLVGINSFGANKVVFVQNYLKSHPHIQSVSFFSDSLNDKPLFDYTESLGGQCYAVNAGEDLTATAKSRHWKELTLYTQEERGKTVFIADVLGI